MKSVLVRGLKYLRKSQPFNYMATSMMRNLIPMIGIDPEYVIRYLHKVGTVSVELPNKRLMKIATKDDDFVSNQIYWRGWDGYEPETTPILWHLARQSQTVLDIGAHVGTMALLAAHANPSGLVFAFEPFPSLFERLSQNCRLNGLLNLHCVHAAVGSADGELELYYHVQYDSLPFGASTNKESVEMSLRSYRLSSSRLRHVRVPIVTIDRFVRERNIDRVDLVKIDTEWTEMEVIRGMVETLRRDRPHLIIEILPGARTLEESEMILAPLGYHHKRLTPTTERSRQIHKGLEITTGRKEGYDNYLFTVEDLDQIVEEALSQVQKR